jgi:isoquinoline 1-oxidoreductase alpha subunit
MGPDMLSKLTTIPHLLWLIRDSLGLSGTKFGCGVGVCGACTVLEDGKAVRACQVPAAEASSRNFVTIEGLSPDLSHPCQRAWLEEEIAQCGYCQAGMIMTACGLITTRLRACAASLSRMRGLGTASSNNPTKWDLPWQQ